MKIAAQGAVLIGGKSSRFGSDKAFIPINKEFISVSLYRMLDSVFDSVCFIGSASNKTPLPSAKVFHDRIPDQGPLRGLLTALENSTYEFTFILACDLPFLNKQLIHFLWNFRSGADGILPAHNGNVEPLAAFYHKNCTPLIKESLENGRRKMDSFWTGVNIKRVDVTSTFTGAEIKRMFFNINSKKDFEKALSQV